MEQSPGLKNLESNVTPEELLTEEGPSAPLWAGRCLPSGREQWLVYLSCLMVFVGFSCARLMISLGLIGFMISGVRAITADDGRWTSVFRRLWSVALSWPAYFINIIFFLVILLSGIHSADKGLWLSFLQIKIPFIILPLAFCSFRAFDRSFFNKILLLFVSCMLVSAACVMVNYLLHYKEINERISSGGIIPVPFSHIRYTLLLVFGFFSLIWLWEENRRRTTDDGRQGNGQRTTGKRTTDDGRQRLWSVVRGPCSILLFGALFLFIVIHVLSSRSGWLALYAGLLFYFFVYMCRSRKYLTGVLMLIALVSLPFVLYKTLPSFHNKIDYMKYTVQEYKAGHIDNMGDAMRITSWQVGAEMIRRHPWTGTGVGDILKESKAVSRELFPDIKNDDDRKMPHNEFIWIWAASGVFGFLSYCFAFFYPFIVSIRYRNWLFVILYIIFFTSFLTEYALEEQIGSTFYLLFLMIFQTHFREGRGAGGEGRGTSSDRLAAAPSPPGSRLPAPGSRPSTPVTALIITLNEEKHIADCIASLSGVADEILVIDSLSEDKTKSIAESLGARVIEVAFQGFGPQRNLGAGLAANDLILALDADERLSPDLKRSITAVKENDTAAAYAFHRLNFIGPRAVKSAGWYPDTHVRMYHRDHGRWNDRQVHEGLEITGEVMLLNGDLIHYSYENLSQLKEKSTRYARLGAAVYKDKNKGLLVLKMIFSPPAGFLKMYIFQAGFSDGYMGWLICYYRAREVFLKYYQAFLS